MLAQGAEHVNVGFNCAVKDSAGPEMAHYGKKQAGNELHMSTETF